MSMQMMQGQPPGPHPHPHPHPQEQQQQQGGRVLSGTHGGTMTDNISKAKSLVNPIKDTLSNVLRTAAQAIYANNMIDSGSKNVDFDISRFDRNMEEFFTLCDQMEVHLRTSIECLNQGMCSQRYLSTPLSTTKGEGTLIYPQYVNVVKGQIAFAKEVHGTLAEAVQKLTD